jgi:hypothetical protein
MTWLAGTMFVLGMAGVAGAAPVPPGCQSPVDAGMKVITTPHHTVTAEGNPPKIGEAIMAGGVNYVKIRDKWIKSPLTLQETVAQEQENIKNATSYNCTRQADDSVAGVPATVYKVHYDMPDVGSADVQIWISKATGLPLRSEEDTDLIGTKRHYSVKYDYADIKAPAVK